MLAGKLPISSSDFEILNKTFLLKCSKWLFKYSLYIFCCVICWQNFIFKHTVESSWNVMAHGDAREGKWRENWQMECVASTLLTTSEHGLFSITTAEPHSSAASSRLNWHPSTQVLQPMQGCGRLKKSPPTISVPGLDPPISDSQPLCIPRHSIHPSKVWSSHSPSALRLVQGDFLTW